MELEDVLRTRRKSYDVPTPWVRSQAFVENSTRKMIPTRMTTVFFFSYMAKTRRSIMSAVVLMPMTVMLPS